MDQVRRPLPSGTDKFPNDFGSAVGVVAGNRDRSQEADKRPPDRRDPSLGGKRFEKRETDLAFESILFPEMLKYASADKAGQPECFGDLNLDQAVATIISGRDEYDLAGYFRTSLTSADDIAYRHEVMRDLESTALLSQIRSFAESMATMRKHLAQAGKLTFRLQQQSWVLAAVGIYCQAVADLAERLSQAGVASRGLQAFDAFLETYVSSQRFRNLRDEVKAIEDDLDRIHYCVFLAGDGFRVHRYRDETDYSAEIEEAFAKFRQGDVKDYRSKLNEWVEMNHVEAKILDFVGQLWPDVFARLSRFFEAERNAFTEPKVALFDRQIQFYLAYIEHMARLKDVGLSFCYPAVSADDKAISATDAFDIALAAKLATEKTRVVGNDFELSGNERILVVSGPNQGGKTTFSRTFGQIHYLASLGLPVPGRDARLFLFDTIFTHFEREEDIANLRGKLQDDLVRVHDILARATPASIVIMNEIFTSTTLQDATFLSEKVMQTILELDLICVWVTFIHELSAFSGKTVSMVSMVDPGNPDTRTYKVLRKVASGRSYAMSIAEKYGLTEERLRERVAT